MDLPSLGPAATRNVCPAEVAVESVYRVVAAIPEIGAVPGDYLRIAPSDPSYPESLHRPLQMGSIVPTDPRLRPVVSSADPSAADSAGPGSETRDRRHLKLVG